MPKIRRQSTAKKSMVNNAIYSMVIKAVAERILAAVRTTPMGIMLIAGLVFYQLDIVPPHVLVTIPTISYLSLIFGMTITAAFNRSRAFFILFILFISQLAMTTFTPVYIDRGIALQGIYAILCILLPLNLLFFSSLPELGITSKWGQRHFAVIFTQAALTAIVILSGDKDILGIINRKFIPLSLMPPTPIPDIAVVIFLVTGVLLLFKRRRTNIHFKTAIFGVLLTLAFAHHFKSISSAIPFFYATAGLIIILSVLQDYYVKAYLDELTGLPSRRSLNEAMLRLGGIYVIAMLDVDFFKKFNDTYGHEAGDDVLRLIATSMKKFKHGKCFRYGGEEFTILFPGKDRAEVIPYLEELRETIAKCKFVVRGTGKRADKKLNVTVSIGVGESSSKIKNPEEIIKLADKALYQAKDNGRNCVS